jgi:phage terminase small subunit
MKMHKDRLTERQRLFCEMYVGPGRHCAALAARLAGYAPGCSHVTGCQLLKQPKIAATVRGLEEALAREMGVSRQAVIAQLVAAAEMAKLMMEPGQIVSALRQIALMSGYYRQEGEKPVMDDGNGLANFERMSDAELLKIIATGQASAL